MGQIWTEKKHLNWTVSPFQPFYFQQKRNEIRALLQYMQDLSATSVMIYLSKNKLEITDGLLIFMISHKLLDLEGSGGFARQ